MPGKLTTTLLSTLLMLLSNVSAQPETSITLLHFSDYHSHALPFYAEGDSGVAGVARAIAYLKPYASDPNSLIFSGGDMINRGSPAWSDKYQYIEWTWFNGIINAMAFGNHDADYGFQAFDQIKQQIDYPILGSNILDNQGIPLFQYNGKTYEVYTIDDIKVGVFAVAGDDFQELLKPATSPTENARFAHRIETARMIVAQLKDVELVNAIVVIGHATYQDDLALAQAVPGIDLIFGSHSHRKQNLTHIPKTDTWIISPSQYLTYISKVKLSFVEGALSEMSGELIRMDGNLVEDAQISSQVAIMQLGLESDPSYSHLYQQIGFAGTELAITGQFEGESKLGNLVSDIVRHAAGAHAALLTSSSFRQPIPPGRILEENLMTALPYKNNIHIIEMTGGQVKKLLDFSVSQIGSDHFSQVSGIRFEIEKNQAINIQILDSPEDKQASYSALNPQQTYRIATSNYQALYASGYKDIFSQLSSIETDIDVWTIFRDYLNVHSPINIQLDGRIIQNTDLEQSEVIKPSPALVNRVPLYLISLVAILLAGGLLI